MDEKASKADLNNWMKERGSSDEANSYFKNGTDKNPRQNSTSKKSVDVEQEIQNLKRKIDETVRIV